MAIYDLSLKHDFKRAMTYLKLLIKNKKAVELREVKPNLSNKFRGYLHVCFVAVAVELGESLQWVKQVDFKQNINSDVFVYDRVNPKTKLTRKALRSTEDMARDELASCLERYKNYYAIERGFRLPDPDEKKYILEIMKAEQENKHFLY